jgi:hypothetical protein
VLSATEVQRVPLRLSQRPRKGQWERPTRLRLILGALYSPRFPSSGETHGLSVVAGAVSQSTDPRVSIDRVIDLAASRTTSTDALLSGVGADTLMLISAPYGTYPQVQNLLSRLAETPVDQQPAAVVLGGATPTYLHEQILALPFERTLVVLGEGDLAAPELLKRLLDGGSFEGIPDLAFRTTVSEIASTDRLLTPPDKVPLPYRQHLLDFPPGTQIFVETSRACSWASCTFCLRGLTDVDGKPREFRRLSTDRLRLDLEQLGSLGRTTITFADEDFLGGDPADANAFARELLTASAESGFNWQFDASATIHSLYRERDDEQQRQLKESTLRLLVEAGLTKIFLGVESGSPTQTRRYNKGHTPGEARRAAAMINRAGARAELGFIMFDPLMSLEEVAQNCSFLLEGNLGAACSAPLNELRLQPGASYLIFLEREERRQGRRLYDRSLDVEALTYSYQYAISEVEDIATAVRTFMAQARSSIYPVKTAVRYGSGGSLAALANETRAALGSYRTGIVTALLDATSTGETDEFTSRAYEHLSAFNQFLDDHSLAVNEDGSVTTI